MFMYCALCGSAQSVGSKGTQKRKQKLNNLLRIVPFIMTLPVRSECTTRDITVILTVMKSGLSQGLPLSDLVAQTSFQFCD